MVIMAQDTEIKEGYKHTEVGVIPDEWDIKKLEELGTWKGGATPSMANANFWTNGTIYWASSGDIKTKILSKTANTITEIAVKQSATTLLKEGAILIVTRSGILRRYLPVAKNTVLMAINQDIKALIPSNQVSADYLLQILSERGPDILSTCMKSGTTVESVEYTWLKKYQIPLPPLSEQRAISTSLSDIDALLTSLDKLIAKKRDIKQATMQQLLTGKMRLPGFSGERQTKYKKTAMGTIPVDWQIAKIGDCAFVTKLAGFEYTNYFDYRKSGPIIAIRALNIKDGKLDLTEIHTLPYETSKLLPRSQLAKDDLVISYVGTLGRVAVIPESSKYHLAPNVAKISVNLDRVDPFYLNQFLNGEIGQQTIFKAAASTTQAALSMHNLREIPFILPSLPEQQAIATVLSDMDNEIAALEQKRAKTRMVKQGMMQELLTGKTRLV